MTALESVFVGLESPDVPFQYACMLVLDRPLEVDALRAHVERMLEAVPRYRQRIVRHRHRAPRWQTDGTFRIDHHIDRVAVPAPGGARELDELTARLIEDPLPDEHSPWRLWTVDGLGGGRGAVIAVVHHSLVDGMAGFKLLEHLLRGRVERQPAIDAVPRATGRLAAVRKLFSWHVARALVRLLREGLQPASQIGTNPRHVGRSRSIAHHAVAIAEVERIERAFGATNNDVVLATVTGALRELLRSSGRDPDVLHDVRAMVPVGRHRKGSQEASGNRVALMLVQLPVDEPDPVSALSRISSTTRHLKRAHTASAGDLLVALSDATTPALLLRVFQLALRMRAYNAIVTNVPGPKVPLMLLGAKLEQIVPVVNLWPHVGLGIAIASYAQTLTFGIQTDRAVIPDAAILRDHLAGAFTALLAAAERASRPAPDRARPMQPVDA